MKSLRRLLPILALIAAAVAGHAQSVEPSYYDGMQWRMIGPFRGGRTVGAAGVPGQPNVFYIGVNNGGVWKTTDYGLTWKPIFDDQPTGSIGTLAVAPSDPNTIYVGSGEGLQRPDLSTGDGMYKSSDAGKTWTHLGLRDGQQIAAIVVDPRDKDRLFVAVLGHPYGPNQERGIYRSVDGGKTFTKALYRDENTGAIALALDPVNPDTIYGVLWSARQGPWENGAWSGEGSGLYKSTDGGGTWRRLSQGLPTFADGLGRIGITVSPSDGRRLYATVEADKLGGVYRSDNAGESWKRVNSEGRIFGRASDFAELKVDPRNPDVVYSANTSFYRSDDAGINWTAVKGSPGGDDYHTIWINPENPAITLLASDQGASISVNGGDTWSSWYNQPTAQFYHVITDNQFPYWVYGGQQESGSAGVASRGNDGQITFREWHPVGVEEYGYVAPDPLHPNLIYGGKISRYDKLTGQVQGVAPEAVRSGKYRFLRTAPVIFSPVNPRMLLFAGNVLFKTMNGGSSWDVISPDLSREHPEVPASVGVFTTPDLASMARRGVIYTLAPSYKDERTIWAGTDDGLIHVTRNGGKTWVDVTPSGITAWSKISIIDAGRFDASTAYAAVNRIRLDDMAPHIWRTHDGGRTWKEIVRGLPGDEPINSVREDAKQPGLLFAGSERAVYFSTDDGENWNSLRLNMPATSMRDLVVHDDDLVVGTHGRSFWILDDLMPLRQTAQAARAGTFLYKPEMATRVRWNMNTDTPLPPEEPGGKNPPDGAIIDYRLAPDAAGPIALEILDSTGHVVRRYSSDDEIEPIDPKNYTIATAWMRPQVVLSAKAGFHRWVWDMHYAPVEGSGRSFPMTAIWHNTPAMPLGPWVMPGTYRVRLTVGGVASEQPLQVRMDPRVKTSAGDLRTQFDLSLQMWRIANEIRQSVAASKDEQADDPDDERPAQVEKGLARLLGEATSLMGQLQGSDMAPTKTVVTECKRVMAEFESYRTKKKAMASMR